MATAADDIEAVSWQTQIKCLHKCAGREFGRDEHIAEDADTLQETQTWRCVKLGADCNGRVIGLIDEAKYLAHNGEAQWDFLKRGAILDFPMFRPIHYSAETEANVILIARADP